MMATGTGCMEHALAYRAAMGAAATRFLGDQRGGVAIEYALIAAGVGAAIASTVWSLGSEVRANLYEKVASIF